EMTRESWRRVRAADGRELRVEGFPFRTGDKHFFIEVGSAHAPIQTALNHVLLSLALAVPLMIALALGGAHVLIGRALTPVLQMTRSAERISLHNLSEQLPITRTGDELEALSLALSNMIRRLNEAFDYTR